MKFISIDFRLRGSRINDEGRLATITGSNGIEGGRLAISTLDSGSGSSCGLSGEHAGWEAVVGADGERSAVSTAAGGDADIGGSTVGIR